MTKRRTHDYHTCRDDDCFLPYCRIWREAWELAKEEIAAAYRQGFMDGEAAGAALAGGPS